MSEHNFNRPLSMGNRRYMVRNVTKAFEIAKLRGIAALGKHHRADAMRVLVEYRNRRTNEWCGFEYAATPPEGLEAWFSSGRDWQERWTSGITFRLWKDVE